MSANREHLYCPRIYLNKSEYIAYWKLTASKDWDAVGHLFEKADYLHALFFAHLMLEKLLKAHFVQDNASDFPPRTHNLLLLISQTVLAPSPDQLRLLSQMNQFQINGRYPDYKMTMFKIATEIYTQSILDEIQFLKEWLNSKLP
ncbi:MAG: HEPN domain-containing protein [Saprospiraceae bacterium]